MSDDNLIDLSRLGRILLREKKLILVTFLYWLLAAVVYVQFAPVLYMAKASILLDKTVSTAVSQIATLRRLGFETESILSEIEILKSDRVLDKVVASLMNSDSEDLRFMAEREDIRDELIKNLSVSRVNETYVMEVQYKSAQPETAAAVANAFANAYIEDQLDMKSDMSLRTVNWLKEKLDEINRQIIEKNRNLIDYRIRYNAHQNRSGGYNKADNAWTLKELDRLETETKAYEELYQSYLEKFKSISVQDNFPVTETRILKKAVAPTEKSQPKTGLVLAAATVLGLGLGIFLAIVRDVKDSSLKRAGQVISGLHGQVLGFLGKAVHRSRANASSPSVLPDYLQLDRFNDEEIDCFRTIVNKSVTDSGSYVVGIASDIVPNLSAQLVEKFASFAAQGVATTVVDGHVRFSGHDVEPGSHPSVWFYGKDDTGSMSLTSGNPRLDLICAESAVSKNNIAMYNRKNITSSFAILRKRSPLVVVNCPPLIRKSEIECYADALDGLIIVLKWGASKLNEVKYLLDASGINREKIIGFVFVDVDMDRMKRCYGHRPVSSGRSHG